MAQFEGAPSVGVILRVAFLSYCFQPPGELVRDGRANLHLPRREAGL